MFYPLGKKKSKELNVSSPERFIHRVHIDDDFNWKGDPTEVLQIVSRLGEG